MSILRTETAVFQTDLPAASRARPRSAGRRGGVPGVALIALSFALLTGLIVGQVAPRVGAPIERQRGLSTEATRVGLEFYDAVESYLLSRQASGLRAMVDPAFVDHVDGQPARIGFDEFLGELDLLHAHVAGGSLKVSPETSSAELVRFLISIPPPVADFTVSGVPVTRSDRFTFRDTLRISGGRVVERWSDMQLPFTASALTSFLWDAPPASTIAPTIQRVTLLSRSSFSLRFGTTHVVVVESGALTIRGDSSRSTTSLPEFPSFSDELVQDDVVVALPREVKVVTGSGSYLIANEGSGVARALLIKIAGFEYSSNVPEFSGAGTSMNDNGVQIELLAGAMLPHDHAGARAIQIGRVTLAPGTSLPQHDVAESELVYVEAGTLKAELISCKKQCVHTTNGVGRSISDRQTLRAGEGISARSGATTGYRVAGTEPVTLFIVTITPAE